MNVMTYDYHTAGESQLGHHAPLKGIDDPSAYDPNEELNLVRLRIFFRYFSKTVTIFV